MTTRTISREETAGSKPINETVNSTHDVDESDHWCACAGAFVSCFAKDERGMTTLEYALTALTAVAIATALYLVVSSGVVQDAFEGIITDALETRP